MEKKMRKEVMRSCCTSPISGMQNNILPLDKFILRKLLFLNRGKINSLCRSL